MAASYLTIEIDSDVRDAAFEVAEYFGLDLASVTRAFYKQIVREHRIPITLSDPEPNDESLEAIRETEELKARMVPAIRLQQSCSRQFKQNGMRKTKRLKTRSPAQRSI